MWAVTDSPVEINSTVVERGPQRLNITELDTKHFSAFFFKGIKHVDLGNACLENYKFSIVPAAGTVHFEQLQPQWSAHQTGLSKKLQAMLQ